MAIDIRNLLNINTVYLNRFNSERFFDIHKREKRTCQRCNKNLTTDKTFSQAFVDNSPNELICNRCGTDAIALGAIDYVKKMQDEKDLKKALQEEIISLNSNYHISRKGPYDLFYLEDLTIDQLNKTLNDLKMSKARQKYIEDQIENEFVETSTEDYLKYDYNVREYPDLKHHLQIEEYFKQYHFKDLFNCGADECEKKVTILVKIGNKFYEVTLEAEINSTKNIEGCSRYYWVESIEKVSYKEVVKPIPLERNQVDFNMILSEQEHQLLLKFLDDNRIEYNIN